MQKKLLTLLTYIALAGFSSFSPILAEETPAPAQNPTLTLNAGVDFVSQYLWRGSILDNTPNIQPFASIGYSGFEFGLWGTQATSAAQNDNTKMYSEVDLSLKYTYTSEKSGSFALSVTDYFQSFLGKSFFNYRDGDSPDSDVPNAGRGAHALGGTVEYNGPDAFPIKVLADLTFHNAFSDKDTMSNSLTGNRKNEMPLYIELGYTFKVGESKISPFLAITKGLGSVGTSNYYYVYTDKLACINAGFTIAKTIKVTNDFSIPISGQFAINPYAEKAYFVFKMSL